MVVESKGYAVRKQSGNGNRQQDICEEGDTLGMSAIGI
jgi:hypothetical protein